MTKRRRKTKPERKRKKPKREFQWKMCDFCGRDYKAFPCYYGREFAYLGSCLSCGIADVGIRPGQRTGKLFILDHEGMHNWQPYMMTDVDEYGHVFFPWSRYHEKRTFHFRWWWKAAYWDRYFEVSQRGTYLVARERD